LFVPLDNEFVEIDGPPSVQAKIAIGNTKYYMIEEDKTALWV
jgi:hypothetical protein